MNAPEPVEAQQHSTLAARVLAYLRDERERYPNGLTSVELAAALGVSANTVGSALSDLVRANCISRSIEAGANGRPIYRCAYLSGIPEGGMYRLKSKGQGKSRHKRARPRARATDVLVLLAIGENDTIQLTADQALDVYQQLHGFFKGRAQ